jgi:threonine/homoserine/homoserine lactone efflux protein
MHLSMLLAFTTALAIAVAIPGPGIFAVVSCAIARGFREALALITGMIAGDLIYFYLAVVGLAALARSLGELFVIVKLIGGVYLVWLGVKLWRQRVSEATTVAPAETAARGFGRNFLGGFVVTISNPKTIGFYAGLLPTFIDLERLSAAEAVVMSGIVLVVVGVIPAAYAFVAARSRRFLARPGQVRLLNRTAGTVMIGTGLTVATR